MLSVKSKNIAKNPCNRIFSKIIVPLLYWIMMLSILVGWKRKSQVPPHFEKPTSPTGNLKCQFCKDKFIKWPAWLNYFNRNVNWMNKEIHSNATGKRQLSLTLEAGFFKHQFVKISQFCSKSWKRRENSQEHYKRHWNPYFEKFHLETIDFRT